MNLRLHLHPGRSGLAPHAALVASGAAFEIVNDNMLAGEHKTSEFRALNPFGVIPVLETGDTVIAETGAILLHIAERFPKAKLLPSDARERQLALRWLFHGAALHADFMTRRRAEFAFKDDPATKTAVQEWMGRRLETAFRAADEAMVGPALAGFKSWIADIYMLMAANWWRPRFDFPNETPRFAAAMQKLSGAPFVREAYSAQQATLRDFRHS